MSKIVELNPKMGFHPFSDFLISIKELSRYDIDSCRDEFTVLFFKELFENIDAKTEPVESPSKDSEPKTDAFESQTKRGRKRSSILISLDSEEIEEF